MHIDPEKAKALPFRPIEAEVERGRLRFFAKATGQDDPIYSDVDAARQAGHPDLPVPPTFFFSLELEDPDAFSFLADLNINLGRILHGEQSFTYHSLAHAGETLVLKPRISDVYTKKGGALQFLVKHTEITRPNGEPVADAEFSLAISHPEVTV